jgi:hypothetical protein
MNNSAVVYLDQTAYKTALLQLDRQQETRNLVASPDWATKHARLCLQ